MALGGGLLLFAFVASLIVGGVLASRGIRGVPTLTDPKCARCGYDLRWVDPHVNIRCPECGSDLKAKRAVRFADYQRQPRVAVIGLCIMLAGAAMPVALFVVRGARRPNPPAAQTPNSTLIGNLATTAGRPWDWQELERRLTAGRLSNQEAAAAVEQLIRYVKARPANQRGPLQWAAPFVAAADSAGAISNERYQRLAVTFFGPQPEVRTRQRWRQGEPLVFEIRYGGSGTLCKWQLVAALRAAALDSEPIEIMDRYDRTSHKTAPDWFSASHGSNVDGRILADAQPGKHQLVFEMDMGLVPADSFFRTGHARPGQAKHWPKTRARWSYGVRVPIEVVAQDDPLVDLVADDALDPVKNKHIAVEAALHPHTNEQQSFLRLTFRTKGLAIAIASAVTVNGGGRTIASATFCIKPDTTPHIVSWEIPRLSPDVRTADVILKPNAHIAEQTTLLDQIWGKEIVFRDVPLQRLDLDDEAESRASRPATRSAGPGTE